MIINLWSRATIKVYNQYIIVNMFHQLKTNSQYTKINQGEEIVNLKSNIY